MPEIKVNPQDDPYSIVIEPGALAQLGGRVRAIAPHGRCLVAIDMNVARPHGETARRSLEQAGYEVAIATLAARENEKTLAATESLYRAMLQARLERKSPVIALGGGITGDIAGYAAATYQRGVPFVHAPTTLLAMVDASIGGKTGVNFPLPGSNDLGKNLIGAFWQPRLVLADPSTLLTLPRRDFVCGLAECIKHAMIADVSLLEWIEQHAAATLKLDTATLSDLISRCASIKAAIVAEDEREHGRRALLNLGHTFAHAIEAVEGLHIHHGEAVSLGLRAASHVATSTKRMKEEEGDRVGQLLNLCELPERLPQRTPIDRLMYAMTFDKKAGDGRMRLVLPRGIGAAEVVDDVPLDLVCDAWRHIGAGG